MGWWGYAKRQQFGQAARKPTCLMAVHLSELTQELGAVPGGQLCRQNGHDRACGRDGQGGWRTAPLKEYPS
eukprot:6433841-Pyramimonas_sp.AAC.1